MHQIKIVEIKNKHKESKKDMLLVNFVLTV